jgi:hypothetical protein
MARAEHRSNKLRAAVLAPATSLGLLAATPALDAARTAVRDLKFSAALPLLATARATTGNPREAVLEILWFEGLASAVLNRRDEALVAFRELLLLEPDFKIQGEPSPKVMTPFYEAKSWATTNGRLRLVLDEPRSGPSGPTAVSAHVEHDALALARGVRFHVRVPSGGWSEERHEISAAVVTFDPPGAREVWAELLGDHDAQLALAGSAEQPLRLDAPVPTPRLEPVAPPAVARPPQRLSGMQWAGVVTAAAGAVALIVGAVFGVSSRLAAQRFLDLEPLHMGTVVNELSQQDAFALNDQLAANAMRANALFTAAGALALAAVVLIVLGRP